jgi:hypothetical protein
MDKSELAEAKPFNLRLTLGNIKSSTQDVRYWV